MRCLFPLMLRIVFLRRFPSFGDKGALQLEGEVQKTFGDGFLLDLAQEELELAFALRRAALVA